jgi:hypothetical protein
MTPELGFLFGLGMIFLFALIGGFFILRSGKETKA